MNNVNNVSWWIMKKNVFFYYYINPYYLHPIYNSHNRKFQLEIIITCNYWKYAASEWNAMLKSKINHFEINHCAKSTNLGGNFSRETTFMNHWTDVRPLPGFIYKRTKINSLYLFPDMLNYNLYNKVCYTSSNKHQTSNRAL